MEITLLSPSKQKSLHLKGIMTRYQRSIASGLFLLLAGICIIVVLSRQHLLPLQFSNTYVEYLATNSITHYTKNDVIAMATPFPNDTDFSDYNTTRGIPPFDIDIVYNYGGYRQDTDDIHARDHGELQYSLRSVYWYMPWFHNIYIVCPDELAQSLSNSKLWPKWLNARNFTNFTTSSNGKTHSIIFVPQSSIMHFNKKNAIGNKNSNAFEMNMHRIPGLTEHFISLCDDFFIGKPLSWKYFFTNTPNSSYYTPRVALSVFLHYFLIDKPSNHRDYDKYKTTYDCDITKYEPQWTQYAHNITRVIPSRVEKYFSHLPRPLSKRVMNQFYAKYPQWFEFVESHKERYCCPNPLYEWKCNRQEGIWLTLYKQYIDFEIAVDIMAYPQKNEMNLPYKVSERDRINFYHANFPIKKKTQRLTEIKPYTFSINDHYSNDLINYLNEFTIFHNFTNQYWPNPAVFEVQFENSSVITWKELAKNIETKISLLDIEGIMKSKLVRLLHLD